MPKDFQGNFLRYKRNEVALNSFLAGKQSAHDFVGATVFISLNSEVKCNSTVVSEDVTSSFFGISKSTWWNIWSVRSTYIHTYIHKYERTYITETFTKLSWSLDKVNENELNLIEKYACAAYGLHNRFRTSDGNRLRFLLFTKSGDNKLRKLSPTKEALQFHVLHSVHAAGRIWGVTLQPSDQIPSLVHCGTKCFKGKRLL